MKDRYEYLKVWLKSADRASAVASGTQEEDGLLRRQIAELVEDEAVGLSAPKFSLPPPCACSGPFWLMLISFFDLELVLGPCICIWFGACVWGHVLRRLVLV